MSNLVSVNTIFLFYCILTENRVNPVPCRQNRADFKRPMLNM